MSNHYETLKEVIEFARTNQYSQLYSALPPQENGVSLAEYVTHLKQLSYDSLKGRGLSHYPESDIRYIASTFNTADLDQLFLLPQLRSTRSSLVKECIEKTKTKVALCASPMFWQYGPLFYRTCRDMQVPAALVSPRNPPVTRQVITETEASYICGSADTLMDIYTELAAHDLAERISIWHFVVPLGAPAPKAMPTGTSVFEYHIFPGVALGAGTTSDGACAINPDYFVELMNGQPLISSLTKEALPLIKYSPNHLHAEQLDADGRVYKFWYEK